MISISKHKGFTLVELMVVVAMIAVIMGALTTSIAGAQKRARIQKATAEVKMISQAILAYENYNKGYELPTFEEPVDVDSTNLKFLLGKGGESESGNDVPVLLLASLNSSGKMVDPWGTTYKVTIRKGNISSTTVTIPNTGFSLPNYNCLTEEERK